MKHDDRNLDIEARLYDALQLPSLEIVEADCESARTRLRNQASFRGRSHAPVAPPWRRLAVIPAAAAVLLTLLVGVLWQKERALQKIDASGIARSMDGRVYAEGENIRSSKTQGRVVTLEDGSRVEMRSASEASVERAGDGLRIRLSGGSIIVNAAKQDAGRHLYVQTKDVTVSVIGTVFFVKADSNGSQVVVIQGEVRVKQGDAEKSLLPGDQSSSNPMLQALTLDAEIGWSREAAAYLAKLHQSMAESLAARQSSRGASVADKPHFEEASIRRCDENFEPPPGMRGGGSNSFRLSPGRVDALCMTVATLIRTAHRPLRNNSGILRAGDAFRMNVTAGLGMENGTHVRGGPDWVRSEHYTIAAVGDGSASAATLQGPMLMELLERRFQLKTHVDVEQVPVYAVTVANGGLKMKKAVPGTCEKRLPSYMRAVDGGGAVIDPAARQRQTEEYRRGATPPECGMNSYTSGPNVIHVAGEVPISSLVQRLSGMARFTEGLDDQLVLDQTAIPDSDLFTFVLEYAAVPPDERFGPVLPGDENIPRAPSIFTALERIGLHLEKIKDSREFVVIDHIEKPSEN